MLKNFQTNPFGVDSSTKFKGYSVNSGYQSIDWFKGKGRGRRRSVAEHADTMESLTSLLDKSRLRFWLVVLCIGLAVLLGRLSYLQLMRGQYYKTVAEGNRVRIYTVKAPRGVIYDRNHELLVKNVPTFSLAVVPVDLPKESDQLNEVVAYLAGVSGKTTQEVLSLIKDQRQYSYQPLVLKENISADEAAMVKIKSNQLPGIILKIDSSRNYLDSANLLSLSHVLGYTGKIGEEVLETYLSQGYAFDDYVGKTGLELSYESELKGQNGREHVEVDALGQTSKVLAYQKPVPGKNVVLTIDVPLQRYAEERLRAVMSQYNLTRAALVVLDPNNGEILALVNLPAYDNNLFASGSDRDKLNELFTDPNQPLFSRAVSGEYPSGSTFKMIVAAAALEEKLITANTGFNSVGGLSIGQWFFPDWKAGGHGWTNVTKALAESVNTFFYIVGGGYKEFSGLGVERIKTYAEKFGLNKKLGVDLPSEASGFLPSEEWKEQAKGEQWYIGDTYHLAIGQGDILVTPLQVAAYTSIFANRGTLYQPHIVKGYIKDGDESFEAREGVVLGRDVISTDTIAIVNRGLREGVLSGSSVRLSTLPMSAAAKTGTAEWSSQKAPHAWMTAFAPYERPEIVITVLIEEGIEGSRVASPVVYDVLQWWSQNR